MKGIVLAVILVAFVSLIAQAETIAVLFDEAHDERNTIAWERALELDPDHPEFHSFVELAEALAPDYEIRRGLDSLDSASLSTADVVVISSPTARFTAAEVAAVVQFVQSGGGLLVAQDANPSSSSGSNQLAIRFGLLFRSGALRSNRGDWDAGSFHAIADPEHPITSGLDGFQMNWGSSIEWAGDLHPILESDEYTWQDVNGNGRRDSNEPQGPLTVAVAGSVGDGRIVFIGDNAFQDSMNGTNHSLFRTALAWLVGPRTTSSEQLGCIALEKPARPVIYFDTAHQERNTLTSDEAMAISRTHPEWYSFETLFNGLAAFCDIIEGQATITRAALHGTSVLILSVPERDFSEEELQVILDFVTCGGGLLLIGEASTPPSTNSVAQIFGLRFRQGVLRSTTFDWDAQSFLATDIDQTHPVSLAVKGFHTNWGTSLEQRDGSSDTAAVIRAGSSAWQDLNNNQRRDASELLDNPILVIAAEFGSGRVAAISDNTFHDSAIDSASNYTLFANSIRWLSDSPSSAAAAPSADLSSLLSVVVHPYGKAADVNDWGNVFAAYHSEFMDRAPAYNNAGFTLTGYSLDWLAALGIPAASYFIENPASLPGYGLQETYYRFLESDLKWKSADGTKSENAFENSAARTVDGQIMNTDDGTVIVMSESSPWWLSFQEESITWAQQLGLSAIDIDTMDRVPLRLGSDFSDWAIQAFRAYLNEELSRATLSSWGIASVEQFDIRSYVRSTSANAALNDPIIKAFHVFEYIEHIDYFGALSDHAHNSGSNDTGTPFFGNLWIGWPSDFLRCANPTVLLGQVVDLIQIEMQPVIPPSNRLTPSIKMARAMGQQEKPVWVLHMPFYGYSIEPDVLPSAPMTNLLRLFLAESYSAGGVPEIGIGGWPGVPNPRGTFTDQNGAPFDEIAHEMDFVMANSELFLDRAPRSDVALVYSVPSFLWADFALLGLQHNVERFTLSLCAKAMDQLHVQYDIVIF